MVAVRTLDYAERQVQAYEEKGMKRGKALKELRRENPETINVLAQAYDESHNGWYHLVDRFTTSVKGKARKYLEEKEVENSQGLGKLATFAKRHKAAVLSPLAAMAITSGIFSPEKPLAVYPYLANQAIERFTGTYEQVDESELKEFLLSREQFDRYRADLVEDFKDSTSEKGFVIVRNKEGNLEQRTIRSVHENLDFLPEKIKERADEMFVSRFDDYVKLEKEGYKVIAHGHYHGHGSPPSPNDRKFEFSTNGKDIVVSNGMFPIVFCNGKIVSPDNFEVDKDLFKRLNGSIPGTKEWRNYLSEEDRVSVVRTFLGYLNQQFGTDIKDYEAIAQDIPRFQDKFAKYIHKLEEFNPRIAKKIISTHTFPFFRTGNYSTSRNLNQYLSSN